jgi:hypothetical protein
MSELPREVPSPVGPWARLIQSKPARGGPWFSLLLLTEGRPKAASDRGPAASRCFLPPLELVEDDLDILDGSRPVALPAFHVSLERCRDHIGARDLVGVLSDQIM